MRSVVVCSFVVVAVVSFSAVITGCSSSEGEATGSQSSATGAESAADSFCESFCVKVTSCDRTADLQTCSKTCEADLDTSIKKLRGDLVSAARTCWEGSDCRQVLSAKRVGECVDESAVSVAPTQAAKSFCDELDVNLRKCGSASAPGGPTKAECLDVAKVFSDETLGEATKCATKACGNIVGCLRATFGS